jgi:hypothetical protein
VRGARRPGDARSGLQRQHLRLADNDHFNHCLDNHRLSNDCHFDNHRLDDDGGTAARPHGPELSVDAAPANAELSRSRTVTYRSGWGDPHFAGAEAVPILIEPSAPVDNEAH